MVMNLQFFGGRGGSSGMGTKSQGYKDGYNGEMENAMDFAAAYALDESATKDSVGYEMYMYKNATGRSLIGDTQSEIDELERAHRKANREGASYGIPQATIDGIKAGMKEKMRLRQEAIKVMTSARAEYEKYHKRATAGNEKAKRRNGKWM